MNENSTAENQNYLFLIQENSMKNLALKDLHQQVIKRLQGTVQYL